jgi:hypothetical protein
LRKSLVLNHALDARHEGVTIMSDKTAILTMNLIEAFKQVNQFITLALIASVSAFALEDRASGVAAANSVPEEKVQVIGGFVPMSAAAAQLLFIGVCFVVAVMASYSLQSVSHIVGRLSSSPGLVEAACTYSSVTTGPIGIRVAGAAIPGVLCGLVIGRKWWKMRDPGLFWVLAFFLGTYALLGTAMSRVPCGPG